LRNPEQTQAQSHPSLRAQSCEPSDVRVPGLPAQANAGVNAARNIAAGHAAMHAQTSERGLGLSSVISRHPHSPMARGIVIVHAREDVKLNSPMPWHR
jgi:hypothetical protein